jgi:hypothetical protein
MPSILYPPHKKHVCSGTVSERLGHQLQVLISTFNSNFRQSPPLCLSCKGTDIKTFIAEGRRELPTRNVEQYSDCWLCQVSTVLVQGVRDYSCDSETRTFGLVTLSKKRASQDFIVCSVPLSRGKVPYGIVLLHLIRHVKLTSDSRHGRYASNRLHPGNIRKIKCA